jgi:O-antigen/teichoic acid export membrane protein
MKSTSKVVSGTIWTAGGSAVQAIIQILRLSILTRYLEKSDFGLVAIVILLLGFTQIFTDLGISVSLFSRQDISRKEYSSLYWVSLILGIVLYAVLCTASPFVAQFYKMPELSLLIPVMGLDLIISTAGRQFRVFLQKEMQFKTLASIDILANTLSLCIAFWIASRGGGIRSLIYSTLFASSTSTFLLIYFGIKTHPLSFYINLKEGKSFYKIGLFQTGSQILDYCASQIDILIIGKLMNASDLGVYNLIKQLVIRVYSLLNPIISRVTIPILAKLNNDIDLLRAGYLQMLKLTSFVNFAIYGTMALLAKQILEIMYGSSFLSAYLILQLFCVWGALTSVMSSASGIIVATGKTNLGFRWTLLRISSNPVFVVVGYQFGFLGIVSAQVLYNLIFHSIYWKIVVSQALTNLTYRLYFLATATNFAYAISLFLLLNVVHHYFNYLGILIKLSPFLLAILYVILYLILNLTTLKFVKQQVFKKAAV